MKRVSACLGGWIAGFAVLILRLTCRIQIHNDQRDELDAAGLNHVFATLHACQVGGAMGARRGTAAMVSRSIDGEFIVPTLILGGHVPIRGSSGVGRKGGAPALQALIEHVRGGKPGMMTVDGPRGPRGTVQKGIALLVKKADAVVIPALAVPSRRWILSGTWDRLQIPQPLCKIDIYFSDPILPAADETHDQLARRVEVALHQLEVTHDPSEATPLREVAAPKRTAA